MAAGRLGAWEATEAELPEWTRSEVIDWSTVPELARGTQPADLIPAGVWPQQPAES